MLESSPVLFMAFPHLNENGHAHIAKEREVDLTFTNL